jgi:hypothetical protein
MRIVGVYCLTRHGLLLSRRPQRPALGAFPLPMGKFHKLYMSVTWCAALGMAISGVARPGRRAAAAGIEASARILPRFYRRSRTKAASSEPTMVQALEQPMNSRRRVAGGCPPHEPFGIYLHGRV